MKRRKGILLSLTFVSLLMGIMLAIQYEASKPINQINKKSISELREGLQKEMELHQRLLTDTSKNDRLLYEYDTSMTEGESLKVMQEELSRIQSTSGRAEMSGPGLLLKIEEKLPNPLSPAADIETRLQSSIFAEDLHFLLTLLFANGAKGITVNEHRIITNTLIENQKNLTLQIDKKTITMPFTIKVVGDPQSLEAALQLPSAGTLTMEEYLAVLSKKLTITKIKNVKLPPVTNKSKIEYMKPIDKK